MSERDEGHGGEDEGRHHPNYMAVWAGLAVLTLIEVGVAFLSLPRQVIVLTLVGLAVWKALLVALYFMHLRFEPLRLVLIAAAPLPLAPILVFAVLAEF
ncbi:MAG: cytochrome C oxidase subunit IV family protein [Gemmatimonadota bacterium]